MAQRPDWMHRADVGILRYLHRERADYIALVANRLGMHLRYAESRCAVLSERGCIEPVSPEVVFRITERGERVLDEVREGQNPPDVDKVRN